MDPSAVAPSAARNSPVFNSSQLKMIPKHHVQLASTVFEHYTVLYSSHFSVICKYLDTASDLFKITGVYFCQRDVHNLKNVNLCPNIYGYRY